MRPTSEKVKQPYSEQEYKTLVDYFTDKGNIDLVLLLQFMWNTGARCGESLKIKLIELDLEKKPYKGGRQVETDTP
jgi:integrase